MKHAIQKAIAVVLALLCFALFVGCDNEEKGTYDGKVFDISELGDDSLTVTSKKVAGGYELTVNGAGKSVDFNKKEDAPWNGISKKVVSIVINDGAERIGDNLFTSISVKSVFLPSSVKSVGENAFSPKTTLYSYSDTEIKTDNKIYYYSEEAPIASGKYFYMIDGEPQIWEAARTIGSVLFIGNSFTFRQGSEDDPMVPRFFAEIADSLGITVRIDFVVRSSYTLAKYADDADELGAKVSLKLSENQYDCIVLQEQSTTPLKNYNSFDNAVKALLKKISATQENAKVYLYQTWGSPAGIEGTSYKTVKEMGDALSEKYDECANDNGISVTHVGNAFSYVYDNYRSIGLYAEDDRHQSAYGAYLSACCHFVSIFGKDVRKSTYTGTLNEDTCRILREVAYDIIKH